MDKRAGGRLVTTNTEKIMEHIEWDRHVAYYNIAQEIGARQQIMSNHLQNAGYATSLDFVCSMIWRKKPSGLKQCLWYVAVKNERDPSLNLMMTGDDKWITCDSISWRWWWSKAGKSSRTVAKPGLTAKKVLLCTVGLERNHLLWAPSLWPCA